MLTYAFCTYNRADRLEGLVRAMRAQQCPIPFEILAVNNNSSDDTGTVLERLAAEPGAPLRVATETKQGIVSARNRAIDESLGSDVMVFIDDDELPLPGTLAAAVDAVLNEGAQCVGGRVQIDFSGNRRPPWLGDELLGFLAALDHGDEPLWIEDASTPIWTANVAYDMRIFREDSALRFDKRYDRVGEGIGGGEDAMMFRTLVGRGARIRYRPDMAVLHAVDGWKLKRRYFLKLHYRAGVRFGRYQLPAYDRTLFRMPPFLMSQFLRQSVKAGAMLIARRARWLREAMNASHALGSLVGYRSRQ